MVHSFRKPRNSHTVTKSNTIIATSITDFHLNSQLIQSLKKCKVLSFNRVKMKYYCHFPTVKYEFDWASSAIILMANAIVEDWVCKGIQDMSDFQDQNTFRMSPDDVVAMVKKQAEETLASQNGWLFRLR
ncbi:hypothetical protein L211DRAFT_850767 [Terfezia boudieri ATCC MYA-4762]|uniref:Uncharacterized protein n=1 Tax=Terfezia boudieri ATCC MYA-4762 TaxID=1051890 RepID=A0A3N4LH79_9PEZI|nr:hypothetical protein L211DRAFT_850767 [Terfezia boudieri ATCC MYA-4762]